MTYPFPGMNPWLDDVRLWRGVHLRLINAFGNALAPLLEPRYFVDVETHTDVARLPDSPPTTRDPAISIQEVGGRAMAVAPTAETAIPLEIEIPWRESLKEAYLAIRLLPTQGNLLYVLRFLPLAGSISGKHV
jgi:hypothetical protein